MSVRNMLPVILLYFYHIVDARNGIRESNLTHQIHQSLLQVNAFLKDVQHKIHHSRSALRSFDYDAENLNAQELLDYSVPSIWWNETQIAGEITPETPFIPTDEFHNHFYTTTQASEALGIPEIPTPTFTPPEDHVTSRKRPIYTPPVNPDWTSTRPTDYPPRDPHATHDSPGDHDKTRPTHDFPGDHDKTRPTHDSPGDYDKTRPTHDSPGDHDKTRPTHDSPGDHDKTRPTHDSPGDHDKTSITPSYTSHEDPDATGIRPTHDSSGDYDKTRPTHDSPGDHDKTRPTHDSPGDYDKTRPTHDSPGDYDKTRPTHDSPGDHDKTRPTHDSPGDHDKTRPTHDSPGDYDKTRPTHDSPGDHDKTRPTHDSPGDHDKTRPTHDYPGDHDKTRPTHDYPGDHDKTRPTHDYPGDHDKTRPTHDYPGDHDKTRPTHDYPGDHDKTRPTHDSPGDHDKTRPTHDYPGDHDKTRPTHDYPGDHDKTRPTHDYPGDHDKTRPTHDSPGDYDKTRPTHDSPGDHDKTRPTHDSPGDYDKTRPTHDSPGDHDKTRPTHDSPGDYDKTRPTHDSPGDHDKTSIRPSYTSHEDPDATGIRPTYYPPGYSDATGRPTYTSQEDPDATGIGPTYYPPGYPDATGRPTYTPPADPNAPRPLPEEWSPSFTFPSRSPEEEALLTTAENSWRPPGPGQDNGPAPEPEPQYPAEFLSTLTRTQRTTSITVSTTPDPRPPGPGHDLYPDDHTDLQIDTATPESPGFPISAELTIIPLPTEDSDESPKDTSKKKRPSTKDKTTTTTPDPNDLTVDEPVNTPSFVIDDETDTMLPELTDTTIPDITFTETNEPETDATVPAPSFSTTRGEDVSTEIPEQYTLTRSTAFTTLHPNISKQLSAWLKEKTNFSDIDVHAWLYNEPSVYMPMTDRTSPTPYPDYSETIPVHPHFFDIFNRSRHPQFTPKTTAIHRQGLEINTENPDSEVPTATGVLERIIIDDQYGLPMIGTLPEDLQKMKTTLIDGRPVNVPEGGNMDWNISTQAGDILHGYVTTPEPRESEENELYKEMDRLRIGFLTMFLLRITLMVATRKPEEIQPVLLQAELIMANHFETAELAFLGQPLIKVVMNIAMAISEGETDALQNYASMLYYMLLNRKETASVDINSIMDYADSLVEDEDGNHLFAMLKDFEEFPNNTKTPRKVAEDLIDAFINPFKQMGNSERRKRLMDSINYALESRFPKLHGAEGFRRVLEPPTEKQSIEDTPTPFRVPSQDTKSRRSNSNINNRKRVRESRNHTEENNFVRQHKRSRVINKLNKDRHSDFNYERMLRRNLYNPNSLELNKEIESITLSTNIQKRFNVITSDKAYSTIKPTYFRTSRNWAYQSYVQLKSRPTTDYKMNFKKVRNQKWPKNFREVPLGRREVKPNKFQRKKHKQKTTVKPRDAKRKEFEKKHLKRRYKTELLRNIVEESSYSDEEEALKVNLISAMIHGNRTFEIKDVDNDTKWRRAESDERIRAEMRRLVEELDAQRDRQNANRL